jgi:hypothetical protein
LLNKAGTLPVDEERSMHDLDRTAFETAGEYELLGEFELERDEIAAETFGGELNEMTEMELASELLEVSNEEELDRFLGDLIKRAGQAAGSFVRSDTGRALGGILKGAARQALPVVGRAVGDWIAPGSGGAIGSRVATGAGRLFGLELEGLSGEDREFEVARSFVRFATAAVNNAAGAPPGAPPPLVARQAAAAAARAHAPGLLTQSPVSADGVPMRRGRWVRQGRSIVVIGA